MAIRGAQFSQAEDAPERDPLEDIFREHKELLRQLKLNQKAKQQETKHNQQKASSYCDKHTKGRTFNKIRY